MTGTILGQDGSITVSDADSVLMFESFFFDRSGEGSAKLNATRLTLETRHEAVLKPLDFLDNLVGSMDAFELELKSLENRIICLHSNDLLLSGSREFVERFRRAIATSKSIKVVLSIALPDSITSEQQGAEFLESHVHYGSSNGLFFGLLGPLVIDSDTSEMKLDMYLAAQTKTGGVLLIVQVNAVDNAVHLFQSKSVDWDRILLVGLKSKADIERFDHIAGVDVKVCVTSRPDSDMDPLQLSKKASAELFSQLEGRSVASTGTLFKTDHKRYGGLGVDAFPFFLRRCGLAPSGSLAATLLRFTWDPPKLAVLEQESEKWVCDVCGLTARLNEKENYTKLGFTYCSIPCLSEHRKRGYK